MVSISEVCRTCICRNNNNTTNNVVSNNSNRSHQQQDDGNSSRSNKSSNCYKKSESSSTFGSSCGLIGSLIALAYIQFVDSISVMVVLPSLVFYVKQVGGTIDDYGIILSFFSLSSVISKPILGMWVDSRPLGIKYKVPYYVSIILGGILGGLIYFLADCIGDIDSDANGVYENYYDMDSDNAKDTDDYHYYNSKDGDIDVSDTAAMQSEATTTTFTFTKSVPVLLILIGRLLGGFGQANETLRDAYLSVMIPPNQFTTIFSLLNMTRVIGLAAAPGFQVLLDRIHWYLPIPGKEGTTTTFHVTSLNSVGLFMAVINFIALIAVWVLLEEPTKDNMIVQPTDDADDGKLIDEDSEEDDEDRGEEGGKLLAVSSSPPTSTSRCNPNDSVDEQQQKYESLNNKMKKKKNSNKNGITSNDTDTTNEENKIMIQLRNKRKALSVWDSIFQIEIILPMMVSLFINSSFHLIETAFAPAVNDALGWGPVECSAVLGSMSILILFSMIIIIALNKRQVSDEILCGVGCIIWCVGSLLIYYLWRNLPEPGESRPWQFVFGVLICIFGFPFTSTCRSLFTRALNDYPTLLPIVGTMQSMISLMPSIAGFVTPGIVASFILRSPQEVAESKYHRELSPLALYVPISTIVLLFGLLLQQEKYLRQKSKFYHATTTPNSETNDEEQQQQSQQGVLIAEDEATSLLV